MKAKSILLLFALTLGLLGCKEEQMSLYDPPFDPSKTPTGTTGEVEDIMPTSVVISGTAQGEDLIDWGFVYSTSADFSKFGAYSCVRDSQPAAGFSAIVKGLTDSATYYIKTFATNLSGGTGFGEVKSFSTPVLPPQWTELEGTWTVTEDVYNQNWVNKQYGITIIGVVGSKTKITIEGVAEGWHSGGGHTIHASVFDMQLTLPSQELLPGWDEPGYRTYFSALVTGNLGNDAGKDFPAIEIATNKTTGKLEIKLLSGYQAFSYQIYDIDVSDNEYAGYWGYCRNTVWVKNE